MTADELTLETWRWCHELKCSLDARWVAFAMLDDARVAARIRVAQMRLGLP